ncbi:hypothetical protein L9F63_010767, partial [Diploptera punctata]
LAALFGSDDKAFVNAFDKPPVPIWSFTAITAYSFTREFKRNNIYDVLTLNIEWPRFLKCKFVNTAMYNLIIYTCGYFTITCSKNKSMTPEYRYVLACSIFSGLLTAAIELFRVFRKTHNFYQHLNRSVFIPRSTIRVSNDNCIVYNF